jgi:hypothetical protein
MTKWRYTAIKRPAPRWVTTWGSTLADAKKIEQLKQLVSDEIARRGLTGFTAESGNGNGDTILISRGGHVHATWSLAGERFSFTQAGYGAPSFTTTDIDQAVAHTMRSVGQTKST